MTGSTGEHCWPARRPLARLAALLLALAAASVQAMPSLELSADMERVPLRPYLQQLEDPSGELAIDDVLSRGAEFRPVRGYIDHGFTRSVWWFRFAAHNPRHEDVRAVLETNVAFLFDVRLFAVEAGRVTEVHAAGLNYPYRERRIQAPHISLPLHLSAQAHSEFYLRVVSYGQMILPATVSGVYPHINHTLAYRTFDNLFYGLGIGIALYNFLLFLSTRQHAFGYYAAYVALVMLSVSASDDGSLFRFWPEWLKGQEYRSIFVWTGGALLLLLLFSRAFLSVRQHSLHLDRLHRLLAAAALANLLFAWVGPPAWITATTIALTVVVFLFLLVEAVLLRLRTDNARMYLWASFALVVLVFLALLCSPAVGLFNEPMLGHYALSIGVSLQMLLLSLGLGRQINELKERDIAAGTELLKARLKEVTAHMEVMQARSESEAKSRFLASMSHEVRTPMNGVLGMAELLAGTRLDNEQKRYASAILDSGRALLNILNDILDYAKIEAGGLELESVPFDLRRLAQDALELYAVQKRRQVEAVLDMAPDVPDLVCGDPTRVRQVLLNLLSNAFKFTEQGRVVLRLHCLSREGDRLRLGIDITDTGTGIAREQQARLFQAFFQADASTTRRFGGTGLGLAISRDLVKLMGGQIRLDSEPGVGTRVHVELPLRALAREQVLADASGEPEPTEGLDGLRVLVAEDNPVNCLVIEGLLRRLGVRYTLTGNGQEALEAYRQAPQRYAAVLMDCEMPVMDGYAAVDAMRILEEETGLPPVPVLALSAHAEAALQQAEPFDAFLVKPVGLAQLRRALLAVTRDRPTQDR